MIVIEYAYDAPRPRYLVALADTRHFGRAAARCHVSQPTLSAQLKKLEESLGVSLVERRPRRLALTAAGEAVVQHARRMLRDADEIRALARAGQDPLAGSLKVGLIPTLGPYLLPRVAPRIAKSLPRLQLHAATSTRRTRCVERTLAGELDLGDARAACGHEGPRDAVALRGSLPRRHAGEPSGSPRRSA